MKGKLKQLLVILPVKKQNNDYQISESGWLIFSFSEKSFLKTGKSVGIL